MKKAYESPKVEWVTLHPSEPIAAPCWSHANKGTPIYHDLPGYGYCMVTLSKSGCGQAKVIAVTIPEELGFTEEQDYAAQQWMMDHLTEKMAAAGNNMASFNNSEFTLSPDPSWS